MRLKLFCVVAILSVTSPVYAVDTANEEQTCSDIGFKKKTEPYGNCVLELLNRAKAKESSKKQPLTPTTPDDATCLQYGFTPGTEFFSSCKMQIDQARRDAQERQSQYAEQKTRYDAELAAYQREKERERGARMVEYSLRVLGGETPSQAIGRVGTGAPIAPTPPNTTHTYLLPGGRPMTCSTMGTVTSCQ